MAVDLSQPVAAPETPAQPTPPPETPVAEQPPVEAIAPPTEETPQETPTEPAKPAEAKAPPDLAAEIAEIRQQLKQYQQEAEYYKGAYTQTQTEREQAMAKAEDDKYFASLQRDFEARMARKAQGLDPNSREYADLYNDELERAETKWERYQNQKEKKQLAQEKQDLIARRTDLGRELFYQTASVTRRISLAKLQSLIPRTDNVNWVDAVANAWRTGYDEATRSNSASRRIAEGTDNIPTGAGAGGLGFTTMEELEAAHVRGDISTATKLDIMAKRNLKYRDGSSPQ